MTILFHHGKLLACATALALGLALTSAAPAAADTAGGRTYITGTEWQRSAERSKLAYVLGIADLMSAEYAFQSARSGLSNSRSAIGRLHAGFSDVSVTDAVAGIDAFYTENPDKLDQTVIEALWIILVKEDTQ